jgi:hypothetical protein
MNIELVSAESPNAPVMEPRLYLVYVLELRLVVRAHG